MPPRWRDYRAKVNAAKMRDYMAKDNVAKMRGCRATKARTVFAILKIPHILSHVRRGAWAAGLGMGLGRAALGSVEACGVEFSLA